MAPECIHFNAVCILASSLGGVSLRSTRKPRLPNESADQARSKVLPTERHLMFQLTGDKCARVCILW